MDEGTQPGRWISFDFRAIESKAVPIDPDGFRSRVRRGVGIAAAVSLGIGFFISSAIGYPIGLLLGFLGVALFGLVYLAIRPNRVAMDEFDPNNIDPLLMPLIEQASQRKRMLWRTSIRSLDPLMVSLVQQNRARFLKAGVIALVDESLASDLKSIPVNEDLLEEEPIITGQLRGMSYTMILPMFVLLSFGSSGVRKLVMGSSFDFSVLKDFLVALFMLYVLLLPWHGRWQLGHFGKRFAGPGWIRSTVGGDGIWTIKDSVLFVRSRPDRPGIHVQLMGPTGSAMSFEFDSLQDEGFIDFWNRWSTRNPRLELTQTINP